MGGWLLSLPPRMSDAAPVRAECPAHRESLPTTFGDRSRTKPEPIGAALITASPKPAISGDGFESLMLQGIFEHVGDNHRLEGYRSVSGPQNGLEHLWQRDGSVGEDIRGRQTVPGQQLFMDCPKPCR